MTRITLSSLDLKLTDALRADATAAPMPETMLRVPDRWVRGRRPVRPTLQAIAVGGVAIAAVVLTFAALPGAHERAPVTPGVDRLRAGAFVSEGENQRIGSVRSSRP